MEGAGCEVGGVQETELKRMEGRSIPIFHDPNWLVGVGW